MRRLSVCRRRPRTENEIQHLARVRLGEASCSVTGAHLVEKVGYGIVAGVVVQEGDGWFGIEDEPVTHPFPDGRSRSIRGPSWFGSLSFISRTRSSISPRS